MQGKSELSFRKDITGDNRNKAIAKDLFFAHQAVLNDTVIDLTSLTFPSEAAPKINSTTTELLAAKLWTNGNNLTLISSTKGTLMQGAELGYTILSSSRIKLNFNADDGEIFTGQIRAVTGTVQGIDGTQFSITGTLTAGLSAISLGQSFAYNANAGSQHGNLVIEVEGFESSLFRTVNNDAVSAGNYYEVALSGNVFASIELIAGPFAEDRDYKIYSTGPIISLPQSGQQQQIDKNSATIDKLVETVAVSEGVPETDFQGTPSAPDLKLFGDRVVTLEKLLNAQVPILTTWASYTPTISASLGSVTLVDIKWRQVGENIEVEGNFETGTVGVGAATMTLPTTLLSKLGSGISARGTWRQAGTSTTNFSSGNFYLTDGVGTLTFTDDYTVNASSGHPFGGPNANVIFRDTERISINFTVPIKDWKATQTLAEQLGL